VLLLCLASLDGLGVNSSDECSLMCEGGPGFNSLEQISLTLASILLRIGKMRSR